ncbi:MAG: 5-(carboxyamino)imidazole ribonucleotide synthase [Cytophagales bacterium]|nr:MAG: 5-(carboxyamino)imidazole ribonucleotide synthase [Cytophagales bacterium]TAF60983.1 MAG: 5-(carboxyamino)imidazole ribonucleotide synthase [Cytophagales bacterium]
MLAKSSNQFVIGMVGGGQLGRMFIQNALNYNCQIHCLDPDAQAPASIYAHHFICGSLTDYQTLLDFGKDCDLITIEIENVNTDALKALEGMGKKVFPKPEHIQLIQDKRVQKQFYKDHQIPSTDFVLTENLSDLQQYAHFLPAVHKLGREGYDGRGVQLIREASDLKLGFDKPSVLEKMADIKVEVAVIVARNEAGQIMSFPPTEMVVDASANLLDFLYAPARISDKEAEEAQKLAESVVLKMQFVGLLAVEMFLTQSGELLVNEIAPRPHNSGHHSIEANDCSQFEQHLRAIMGWPLATTNTRCKAAMLNLLGERGHIGAAYYEGLEQVLAMPLVFVHLYGKQNTKPMRKMGHVTVLGQTEEEVWTKTNQIKQILKVKARP